MADEPDVTILGSGGWFPTAHRQTTSVLVRSAGETLVLDAGTGIGALTGTGLGTVGRRLHVLLTHFHLDHVVGLSCLPALGEQTEVIVWGPGEILGEPTLPVLEGLFATPLFPVPLARVLAEVHELTVGTNVIAGMSVEIRHQQRHPGGSVGVRIGEVAFITDTEPDPGTVDFVEGCRTLIHEAWQPVAQVPGHSAAREVAQIASRARVGSLVLSHVHPVQDAPEALLAAAQPTFPATRVATDLERLP